MHIIIRKIVKEKGTDIICSNVLINCIDDEGGFSDVEMRPYKKILKGIVADRYSQKLLDIGAWNAETELLVKSFAQKNMLQEDGVLYVFSCLAYGLGWLKKSPKLPAETKKIRQQEAQKKAKEAEAAQKANEEAIRQKAEETARKKAEIAEKRALEAERRAKDAEKKALEAEEALRKRGNAAEKRRRSASEQIPAQEVSVTNIANFANATRYLKELERTFEEITKSTKGQKAKWNRMADALNTFPLPTAREELFTFAVSMHSKMSEKLGGEGESEREAGAMLMTAYLSKYKECILKVKSLYPTDSVFANLLSTYDEDIKKAKSAIWWQKDHTILWVILGLVGMMFLCFVPLAIFGDGETSSESDNVEMIGLLDETNSGSISLTPTKSGEFVIPANIERIEANAFNNNKELKSIVISESVKVIENGAFDGCSNLISVTINSDMIVNKDYNKSSLSNVFGPQVETYILGESVRGIGKNTFAKCYDLKSIIIPTSVLKIGKNAFNECAKLTSVTINSNAIIGRDFDIRSVSPMAEIFGPQVQEFIIGGDVKNIGNNAFNKYSALRSITIKKNVESIGNNAFKNCSNLSSIKIPGNVKRLGANSFRNCNNLISVTISEGVDCIDEYAFADCTKLTSFKIPKSLTYLGKNIFEGCTNLTKLYLPKGKKYNSEQIFRSDCKMIRY